MKNKKNYKEKKKVAKLFFNCILNFINTQNLSKIIINSTYLQYNT